jgi:tetratricopeptide (TPR) repeat protein
LEKLKPQKIEKLISLDYDNKILHHRAMQIALKSCDLALAISHLKEALRIEYTEAEDALLAELILQRGLLDMQVGGKWIGGVRPKIGSQNTDLAGAPNRFRFFSTKYYEAVAFLMGGRKKEALERIEDMLKDDPKNTEAYVLKGKFEA